MKLNTVQADRMGGRPARPVERVNAATGKPVRPTMRQWRFAVMAVMPSLLVVGCDGPAAPPAGTATTPTSSTSPASHTVAPSAPTATPGTAAPDTTAAPVDGKPSLAEVRVVDKAAYDQIIASFKGKVVLVDIWATWCGPCVKAFPETVQLHRDYAAQGLVVVSLSLDSLDDDQSPPGVPASVPKFLAKQQADFPHLISGLEIDASIEQFAIDGGAIPHLKLYGRDGQLIRAFGHGDPDVTWDHSDIKAAVEAALEAK